LHKSHTDIQDTHRWAVRLSDVKIWA